MKQSELIVATLIALSLGSACSDDDKLGTDIPLAPPYTLPERGESEAGDRVIDFFEKYSSFLLYNFTQEDFQWETVSSGLKYEAVYGDSQYLGDMLEFLDEIWLDFYSDKFKQEKFPFKIFLMDSIAQRPKWEGQPTTYHRALARETAVAIAGMNGDLKQMTAKNKKLCKDAVNVAFVTFLLNQNKLDIPAEFYAVSDYTKFASYSQLQIEPDILRSYGYLPNVEGELSISEWSPYGTISEWATGTWSMDPKNDIKSFLLNMVMHGNDFPVFENYPSNGVKYADRFTWNYYLQKNADGSYKWPLIKKKLDILENYFKDKYQVDLAVIGNKTY
ncbi:hypothetical protein [Bacteroides reticulotermitis]|uniref:Lipoprotein n=1 Tax=Bacteroides reticulotermitis JCM 10512 TaxID=1445607 RepID=W4USB6_9BACE|nr:hypothetical protein [Bacteroides reticulotermitis]GAE83508.1 hypothetical protein JCM10512_1787 [Bacteroides reticulotermitis JCM 10512]